MTRAAWPAVLVSTERSKRSRLSIFRFNRRNRSLFKLGRRSPSDRPTSPSTIQRFSLLSVRLFCHSQGRMRLLAEILIIAALIYFGWNTPFKEQVAQANTTITTKLHGVGSKLQKHQDPSVRRY
jgi:hypothetical protein